MSGTGDEKFAFSPEKSLSYKCRLDLGENMPTSRTLQIFNHETTLT